MPTQSCMRTVSDMLITRKISNSTGTVTAPPPMPKSPASKPVTTPAAATASASDNSSFVGTVIVGKLARERSPRARCAIVALASYQPTQLAEMLRPWHRRSRARNCFGLQASWRVGGVAPP